ncbi:hypothetical protein [Leifsonia sp. NCR5]|uniref:hypothetical protein n=1 Tax=Leifsonia sp. NCR5 TaxID=1978342 RepID=UPI000A18B493|nr:hypothetical protein [Leifsonia sp. NCR5]
MDEDLAAVVDDVNRLLVSEGWHRVRADSKASWFGHFVSDIVLAIGVRAIDYADSHIEWDANGAFSARVVVFTDKTVVIAGVMGVQGDDDVKTEVAARPRGGLVQLSVGGAGSLFTSSAFSTWPGDFKITAEWDHGAKVTLPLSKPENQKQRDAFMSIYRALSNALGE